MSKEPQSFNISGELITDPSFNPDDLIATLKNSYTRPDVLAITTAVGFLRVIANQPSEMGSEYHMEELRRQKWKIGFPLSDLKDEQEFILSSNLNLVSDGKRLSIPSFAMARRTRARIRGGSNDSDACNIIKLSSNWVPTVSGKSIEWGKSYVDSLQSLRDALLSGRVDLKQQSIGPEELDLECSETLIPPFLQRSPASDSRR